MKVINDAAGTDLGVEASGAVAHQHRTETAPAAAAECVGRRRCCGSGGDLLKAARRPSSDLFFWFGLVLVLVFCFARKRLNARLK